jgi:hypothetical protein
MIACELLFSIHWISAATKYKTSLKGHECETLMAPLLEQYCKFMDKKFGQIQAIYPFHTGRNIIFQQHMVVGLLESAHEHDSSACLDFLL